MEAFYGEKIDLQYLCVRNTRFVTFARLLCVTLGSCQTNLQ